MSGQIPRILVGIIVQNVKKQKQLTLRRDSLSVPRVVDFLKKISNFVPPLKSKHTSWQHLGQTFAHARVVRRRNTRTSTDDDDSTSLPMVVDCSDTSLVGILHNFHCEHCCLLCFLALVLDCDNNSCKEI